MAHDDGDRDPGTRRRRLIAIAGAAALAGPSIACAQQPGVDLLLVLAVDASGSVNQQRFELQRQGYADAFRHPRVVTAIRSGPARAIAVTMFQWTGPSMQRWVVPWHVVRDDASAESFAQAVETAPRQLFGGGTSISGAIDYSVRLLGAAPIKAPRRIIDVSGDGLNSGGRDVKRARDDAVALDIRINGLPILSLEPNLDEYFRENVIGGPGAFAIAADSYETFAAAILNKLVMEIAMVR
ncbi:MAG: DUF1194 domain-containing protein [Alphaproteobacteria bacterium]|nr:DUF1194 domain-containing protein [Alphaproteobacteria bacterium]